MVWPFTYVSKDISELRAALANAEAQLDEERKRAQHYEQVAHHTHAELLEQKKLTVALNEEIDALDDEREKIVQELFALREYKAELDKIKSAEVEAENLEKKLFYNQKKFHKNLLKLGKFLKVLMELAQEFPEQYRKHLTVALRERQHAFARLTSLSVESDAKLLAKLNDFIDEDIAKEYLEIDHELSKPSLQVYREFQQTNKDLIAAFEQKELEDHHIEEINRKQTDFLVLTLQVIREMVIIVQETNEKKLIQKVNKQVRRVVKLITTLLQEESAIEYVFEQHEKDMQEIEKHFALQLRQ